MDGKLLIEFVKAAFKRSVIVCGGFAGLQGQALLSGERR